MVRRDAFLSALLEVAALATACVVLVVVLPRNAPKSAAPAAPRPPSTARTTPAPVPTQQSPTLVVKIDNAPAARPQTGIGAADVVYVEPVEGGLTRLAAVYTESVPPVVGPVRSARESDVDLLAAYGRPILAYSGVAPTLSPSLAGAPLVSATARELPGAYFRDRNRPTPHNLYLRPSQCSRCRIGETGRHAAGTPAVHRFGPAPAGGTRARVERVDYRSTSFEVSWLPGAHRWLVAVDGAPITDTESGRLEVGTVVVQQVATHGGQDVVDASGSRSPVVDSVGSGAAFVLRDGKRFDVRWSRPSAGERTRFTTAAGQEVPMAPGPVWIFLVPGRESYVPPR